MKEHWERLKQKETGEAETVKIASLTQRTWSGRQYRTEESGMLESMGCRVGHNSTKTTKAQKPK